jgi:hypothetical protein
LKVEHGTRLLSNGRAEHDVGALLRCAATRFRHYL